MTQPPAGWSSPGGEPPPAGPAPVPAEAAPPPPPGYGGQPGYGTPPPGYGTPPPGYGTPPAPGWPPGAQAWQPSGYGPWGAPVVTPGVVPLRPLTVGEVLDGAVKVVRRYPRPTLGLSAVVAVVTTALNLIAVLLQDTTSLPEDVSTSDDPFTAGFGGPGGGIASISAAVVGWLGGLVLAGFLVFVVGRAVLGRPTTFAETWQQVRPRLWALLGLTMLVGLVVTVPLGIAGLIAVLLGLADPVLLVIGIPLVMVALVFSVHAYVRLSLSTAALVLEKAGIREAMRRSAVLVKGDWWRVFGILLLVSVIASVVSGVLTAPFAIAGGIGFATHPDDGGFTVLAVVLQVAAGLASLLVAPFTAGARSLLYVDRRMRAEGLDLTLQAAARQQG